MSKADSLKTLVILLAKGLCHKIGSIVNSNAVYSQKYLKEADNFFNLARDISNEEHWNLSDREKIKEELIRAVRIELERRDFLDEKKFDYILKEVEWILKELGIG
ncbi:MAG: hypothetical protein AABX66_01315 [Nanoarchaeota archaeon]|mgnify:CR=1 FL=1